MTFKELMEYAYSIGMHVRMQMRNGELTIQWWENLRGEKNAGVKLGWVVIDFAHEHNVKIVGWALNQDPWRIQYLEQFGLRVVGVAGEHTRMEYDPKTQDTRKDKV